MTLEQLLAIRDEISALLLEKVDGSVESEHACVTLASKQLEQFCCMGGSTRAKAEGEIVRLLRRFDDTHESGFGPWPVSSFMQSVEAKGNAYKRALQCCIDAHKSGGYQPMVVAIENARKLLEDLK